jgi:hypothetical protein
MFKELQSYAENKGVRNDGGTNTKAVFQCNETHSVRTS